MQLLSVIFYICRWSILNGLRLAPFVFFCLFFFSASQQALAKQIPGVIWERSFGDDDKMNMASAITIDPRSETVFIAGTSSEAGGSGNFASFWLWEVDTNGNKVREIPIQLRTKIGRINPAFVYIKSITILDNRNIVLMVEYPDGNPLIIIYDIKGHQVLLKELQEYDVGRGVVINRILSTKDNGLLLIGRKRNVAYAMRINHKGELQWKKEIRFPDEGEGTVMSLIDGIRIDGSNEFILLGNASKYTSHFYPGPSNVWLIKLDDNERVVPQNSIPGRYGSISHIGRDKYGVVFDESQSEKQKTVFIIFDSAFKEVKRTLLYSNKFGFSNKFFITGYAGDIGHVFASGTTGHKLLLFKFDKEGKNIWKYLGRGVKGSRKTIALASAEGIRYVLTYINSENKERKVNFKVGLIKLSME